MSTDNNILTPVGRLVMGDPYEAQTKDAEGNQLVYKHGPQAGQPRVDYFLGLAIPKTDPGVDALRTQIHAVAREAFPAMFDAAGNCQRPGFAFKYKDGDDTTPNAKGVRPCDREGWAGSWVFMFGSSFAPKCYDTASPPNALVEAGSIKRGYYIRISGTVKGNGAQNQPGVYLNHNMVQMMAYGEEIITGPSAEQVFGGTAPALPAGASTTPVASPSTPPPAAAPTTGVSTPTTAVPAPAAPAVPPPITPANDFLDPANQSFMVQGQAFTRAQLQSNGWSEELINALPPA